MRDAKICLAEVVSPRRYLHISGIATFMPQQCINLTFNLLTFNLPIISKTTKTRLLYNKLILGIKNT